MQERQPEARENRREIASVSDPYLYKILYKAISRQTTTLTGESP